MTELLSTLRRQNKLGPTPVHRNTFLELFFEYSEINLTPISYMFWGVKRFVLTATELSRPDILCKSLEHMNRDERLEVATQFREVPTQFYPHDPYKMKIPKDDILSLMSLYHEHPSKGLIVDIFAHACMIADTILMQEAWNIMYSVGFKEEVKTLLWCKWSMVGGHPNTHVASINKNVNDILRVVIRNDQLEMTKMLVEYAKGAGLKLRGFDIEAGRSGNLDLIRYVWNNLPRADYLSCNMGIFSDEAIELYKVELGMGSKVKDSLEGFAKNGRKSLIDLLYKEYGFIFLEYKSVLEGSIICGHEDIYLAYKDKVSLDMYTDIVSVSVSIDLRSIESDLLLRLLYGDASNPTMEIYTPIPYQTHSKSKKFSVVITTERSTTNGKIQFTTDDDTSVEKLIEMYDTSYDDHNNALANVISEGLEFTIEPLKYFLVTMDDTYKYQHLLMFAKMGCYSGFREVLKTVPLSSDMTSLIVDIQGYHMRFVQLVIRLGYSYNEEYLRVNHPKLLESIKKMK